MSRIEELLEKYPERDAFILDAMRDSYYRDANLLTGRDEDLDFMLESLRSELIEHEKAIFRKIIKVRKAKENSMDGESILQCIFETEEYEALMQERKELLELIKYVQMFIDTNNVSCTS